MRALRNHQQKWVVTVTRKHNPPRKITVFGRSLAEAIQDSAMFGCLVPVKKLTECEVPTRKAINTGEFIKSLV